MSKSTKLEQGTWTDGRIRSFITTVLRGGMRRWPPKWNVLKKACIGKAINPKTKRMGNQYTCVECDKTFSSTQVQVDHIKPVVDPKVGFVNWDTFIERLFVDESKMQILCLKCHKEKSKAEQLKRIKHAV